IGNDRNNSEAHAETKCYRREEGRVTGRQEYIDLDGLIQRDGGVCYVCGKEGDERRKFRRGHPRGDMRNYPTIDHVVPLSRGGEHVWENVKLAHHSCNTKKGGRIVDNQSA